MKRINKLLVMVAVALAVFVSCVDEYKSDFLPQKPDDVAVNEFLNSYDVLKTYINRSANPQFKLGMGVTIDNFIKKETVYSLAVSNFEEVTASSGMFHNAIVKNDGAVDFYPVESFLETAQAASISVHGLSLCSNSQLNETYLNNSIAPIPVPPSTDASTGTVLVNNFEEDALGTEYAMTNGGGSTVTTDPKKETNKVLHVTGAQTHAIFPVVLPDGVKLGDCKKVTLRFNGPGSGGLYGQGMRLSINGGELFDGFDSPSGNGCPDSDWGNINMDISGLALTADEKKLASFNMSVGSATGAANYYIDDIKIEWELTPASDLEVSGFEEDAIDATYPTTNGGSATVTIDPKNDNNKVLNVKGAQTHPVFRIELPDGVRLSNCKKIKLRFFGTGSTGLYGQGMRVGIDGGSLLEFPSPSANGCPDGGWGSIVLDLTTITWSKSQRKLASFDLAVGSATGSGDYYIDDLAIEWEFGAEIERTDEEITEIITNSLDSWIEGMMKVNSGYIKAWDVVSYPMSDDNDLMLKSAELEGNTNFYWSDYMGENYARSAVQFARKHYVDNGGNGDLKLFVAESGLENNPQKCERLIQMIQQWEADGTTKIDGISSQMHISYSMDPTKQSTNEQNIVDLLNLLKNSGKLIRISELDMNLVDAGGAVVELSKMTLDQQIALAEYYNFIVRKYLEIIPSDKQYGITLWTPVDGMNGERAGLWDRNYNRKRSFAGFVNGLAGEENSVGN